MSAAQFQRETIRLGSCEFFPFKYYAGNPNLEVKERFARRIVGCAHSACVKNACVISVYRALHSCSAREAESAIGDCHGDATLAAFGIASLVVEKTRGRRNVLADNGLTNIVFLEAGVAAATVRRDPRSGRWVCDLLDRSTNDVPMCAGTCIIVPPRLQRCA